MAGFTQNVNKQGYATILYGGRATDFENVVVINTLGVDGYCFLLSGDDKSRKRIIRRLEKLRQPIVLAQEIDPRPNSDICIIRQDDFGGGLMLVDHLISHGARRLVFVTPKLQWPALNARVAGLKSGIKSTGLNAKLEIVKSDTEAFVSVVDAVAKYLKKSSAAMIKSRLPPCTHCEKMDYEFLKMSLLLVLMPLNSGNTRRQC